MSQQQKQLLKKKGYKPINRHWYNDGHIEVQQFFCPEGFVPGRIKKK